MIPGRNTSTNMHYVSWYGPDMEANIDAARVKSLAIDTPEANAKLTGHIENMIKAGVEGFEYAIPAANGFIVKCDNPQQAYDAAYKNEDAPVAKSNLVSFVPTKMSGGLNEVFGNHAQNDNGVSRAPKIHAMFDRAVKGFGLGEHTLDVPALAA